MAAALGKASRVTLVASTTAAALVTPVNDRQQQQQQQQQQQHQQPPPQQWQLVPYTGRRSHFSQHGLNSNSVFLFAGSTNHLTSTSSDSDDFSTDDGGFMTWDDFVGLNLPPANTNPGPDRGGGQLIHPALMQAVAKLPQVSLKLAGNPAFEQVILDEYREDIVAANPPGGPPILRPVGMLDPPGDGGQAGGPPPPVVAGDANRAEVGDVANPEPVDPPGDDPDPQPEPVPEPEPEQPQTPRPAILRRAWRGFYKALWQLLKFVVPGGGGGGGGETPQMPAAVQNPQAGIPGAQQPQQQPQEPQEPPQEPQGPQMPQEPQPYSLETIVKSKPFKATVIALAALHVLCRYTSCGGRLQQVINALLRRMTIFKL